MNSSSLCCSPPPLPQSLPSGYIHRKKATAKYARDGDKEARFQPMSLCKESCNEDLSTEILPVFDARSSSKADEDEDNSDLNQKPTGLRIISETEEEDKAVNFPSPFSSRQEDENDKGSRSAFYLTRRKSCSYQAFNLRPRSPKYVVDEEKKREQNDQPMSTGSSSFIQNAQVCTEENNSDSFGFQANFFTQRETGRKLSYTSGVSLAQSNYRIRSVSLLHGMTSTCLSTVFGSITSPTSSTDLTSSFCSTFDVPENILFPDL
mmetsp:Transcript_46470/g.68694  ORF Transcript_46470/g.68694 Transcript_46470/m.68694 type:complete len:263 (+) Transcript_46470:153-941(+)